ncbi:hypothetical protein [Tissierella sp.]|uniref:hypothetical protein n=1 Tax=Tissierella sp. TaxID=41274 RepID=UPI003F9BF935
MKESNFILIFLIFIAIVYQGFILFKKKNFNIKNKDKFYFLYLPICIFISSRLIFDGVVKEVMLASLFHFAMTMIIFERVLLEGVNSD